jgi:hypothetical protein
MILRDLRTEPDPKPENPNVDSVRVGGGEGISAARMTQGRTRASVSCFEFPARHSVVPGAAARESGKSLPIRSSDMLSCALTALPLLRILGEALAHFSPMDLLISAVILIEAAATMPPGRVTRWGRSTPATTYARSLFAVE